MHLLPKERDKLLLHQAGALAQRRLARGLRLNYAEATALIASQLQELIRDSSSPSPPPSFPLPFNDNDDNGYPWPHTVASLQSLGKRILGTAHVLPDVPSRLREVQVEGTFKDGTFLVSVHEPVSSRAPDLAVALWGSFLPVPAAGVFPVDADAADEEEGEGEEERQPGAVIIAERAAPVEINVGRERVKVRIANLGDRPIQVGSHYPLSLANPHLAHDRLLSHGKHLDIPAGTAVRFEPGESKSVRLVSIGGARVVRGGTADIAYGHGRLDEFWREDEDGKRIRNTFVDDLLSKGFRHVPEPSAWTPLDDATVVSRQTWNALYGPTVGDRVRLGDSALWIEVEKDYTCPGDECVFGGGKVLRDGMGQACGRADKECLDLVVTNALVVNWSGIYKADVGIVAGKISGIGKAGNPDVMDGVTEGMVVGSNTEVVAGEHLILTAGGIDAHVHYICPDLCEEALASGLTTLIGGGTGPVAGTNATTCTPSAFFFRQMLQATDGIPLNFAFTGKGNDSGGDAGQRWEERQKGLVDQVKAGAAGLKIHEDWGSTPAAIDACLSVCDKYDIQCNIHTDTLNESGFVETTIAAFKGRTIHTYHSEGAGGGHAPDIITVCGQENVLPSSTNPTRPYAKNTLDEHLDMLMVCHHLDKSIPEDVAFADSRIRKETVAAEDVLQDIGAISMVSSDSQAMGRIGEVVARTWRTAAKMREVRGPLSADKEGKDNERVKRYIAKYTINPAIVHGISHVVGDISVGKLADMVLWSPANFGVKPEMVIKGGTVAWAQMGDANASIPTVQPIYGRKMWGCSPEVAATNSFAFVSQLSIVSGAIASYNLRKRVEAVRACRGLKKSAMKLNDALPVIKVDPETYDVHADGTLCDAPAATELPMTVAHHLF